jgi:hypothetical protein
VPSADHRPAVKEFDAAVALRHRDRLAKFCHARISYPKSRRFSRSDGEQARLPPLPTNPKVLGLAGAIPDREDDPLPSAIDPPIEDLERRTVAHHGSNVLVAGNPAARDLAVDDCIVPSLKVQGNCRRVTQAIIGNTLYPRGVHMLHGSRAFRAACCDDQKEHEKCSL